MPTDSIDEYAEHLLGNDNDLFRGMREDAAQQDVPMIQVPPELGRLLTVLVATSGARTALEIGTLFGFSGILLAGALPDNGMLTTLEVSSKHAAIARKNFEQAGVANKVKIIEGDAAASLQTLQGETFDLIFIDADKPGYPRYLDFALTLSHVGTVIVADNVWRGGQVLTPGADEGNRALSEFNQKIAADSRLLSTFVSTRSGGDAVLISVVRTL